MNIRGYHWNTEQQTERPKRCPRCGGWIPNDDRPGEYPGAMSRYMIPIDGELSRCIEICSSCGEHESFQQMGWAERGSDPSGLTPPHDWPIEGLHKVLRENEIQRHEQQRQFQEWQDSPEGQAALAANDAEDDEDE